MSDVSSINLYRLKKELQELEDKKGRGTELVSLYIPADKNLDDVMSQMREEYSQASNIKSKRTRKNVLSALETIMQRLKLINRVGENGLVLLVGTIPRGTQDKIEVHMITPPQPIVTYRYHCDSQFYLTPLKEMLEERGSYGLLVMDRREATIGVLKGKIVETLLKLTSNVPGKTHKGGQSQARYARLREISAHEFFVRIARHCEEIFLNMSELKGLIIGGPGPTKDYFVKEGYLHHELQKKILNVFDVSYTNEFGLSELVEAASGLFKDMDINREKTLMQRFLSEVVKDDGLAAYGDAEVRRLIEAGAVETLLVSEEHESFRVRTVCQSCGHTEDVTVKDVALFEDSLARRPCARCNEHALVVADHKSSIEELAERVKAKGGTTEVISTETEEGQQLVAFGGIGAILRFRA
ncbi:MAG: peptide chain release factor 1 [Methanobacteriota archaeon]|nr:MAG: peptide chain release factor 1 [Euryarchaeota archaeon]